MADISATLRAWSTTAASNQPQGSTTIGAGLDDNLRAIQQVVRQFLASQGTNMASAATLDLSTMDGSYAHVTGTTTTTALGTEPAGISYWLEAEGAWPITHNATSLILIGGASITCAAGDVLRFTSEGSGNWRQTAFFQASGRGLGWTVATPQNSSGTALDFTIPTSCTGAILSWSAFSTNSTSVLLVQLGDAGGIETNGYVSRADRAGGSTSSTAGFILNDVSNASAAYYGSLTLTQIDPATFKWIGSGTMQDSAAQNNVWSFAGGKATSQATTTIRITSASGDTLDAGTVGLMYHS